MKIVRRHKKNSNMSEHKFLCNIQASERERPMLYLVMQRLYLLPLFYILLTV
jgi:hypothetical protein